MANRMASAIANRMANRVAIGWQIDAPNPNPNPNPNSRFRDVVFALSQSSICLSNWSARETPWMSRYAAEIGGGLR